MKTSSNIQIPRVLTSVLLSVLLVLTTAFASANLKTGPEDAEKAIIVKEKQALEQWSAGNPAGFTVNFAKDATYFDDIAAHTRLDGIEEINKYMESIMGMIPPHKYKVLDPKVQLCGEVGILTMQYHGFAEDGTPGPPWKATSVYHKINGEWKVVHAHWSLVKAEK